VKECAGGIARIIEVRSILPVFKNRLPSEITSDDLRELCNKGAPATAVHVRDIAKQIYGLPSCTIAERVVAGAYEVLEGFERVRMQRDGMRSVMLDAMEQGAFAEAALSQATVRTYVNCRQVL